MRRLLPLLGSTLLIVTSSLVPPLTYVALVALAPALCVLHDRSVRQTAVWSMALFFFVALGAFYWVAHVAHRFGGLPLIVSWAAVIAFGFMNIWQGVIGFTLFRWLRDRIAVPRALLFALCIATAWQTIPALFYWDLSLLVREWYWLIQCIDLIGTYGLDLFLAFANYAAFECWQARCLKRSGLVALIALGLLLTYGAVRSQQITAQLGSAPTVRVALIQPNIDSGRKADLAHVETSLGQLFDLSTTAVRAAPDLVVWPESTFPIDYERDPTLQRILTEKIATWKTALFFGNNRIEHMGAGRWRSFNSATLLTTTHPAQYYSKHVLLAFGEYIPFEETIPLLRAWFPDRVGAFGRGPGPTRLSAGHFSFGPVICYESIIASYMRRVAALPIDFITEISNDGWYGRTTALRYHKDLTVLRAIENRITVARDTNTGITTFVDPVGQEHHTMALETPAIAIYDIPQVRPWALFTRYGHYALPMGQLLMLIMGAHSLWRRR